VKHFGETEEYEKTLGVWRRRRPRRRGHKTTATTQWRRKALRVCNGGRGQYEMAMEEEEEWEEGDGTMEENGSCLCAIEEENGDGVMEEEGRAREGSAREGSGGEGRQRRRCNGGGRPCECAMEDEAV